MRLVQEHAVYAGMIEAMDLAVGKVLAALDELGLHENTLLVFTSDNGGLSIGESSPTSNLPLRGGKGLLYEGGIRVPLLVRWPGTAKPGAVVATPVSSPDLFPTLLDAAGARPAPRQQLDGHSLRATLEGRPFAERPLFWHYPHYGNLWSMPGSAVRRGGWKLIEWFKDGRAELFHLATDPSEKKDLAVGEPQRVGQLRAGLHAWRDVVGALFPTANPRFDPAKPNGPAAKAP